MRRKALAALAASVLCLALSGCGETTINLNDYVAVEYTGLNTRGEARLDEEAVKDAVEAVLYENAKKDTNISEALENVMSACRFSLDKEEGLSNGDTVTVSATINNELCKDEKIKLEFEEFTDTVSGLKEVPIYTDEDLFAGLKVDYTGISPAVTAEFKYEPEDANLKNLSFQIKGGASGLKKGETITVVCDAHDTDDYLIAGDATLEKQFVVDGVGEYINSAEQVSDNVFAAAKEALEGRMENVLYPSMGWFPVYQEGHFNNLTADEISNIKCNKVLALTRKDTSSARYYNYIIYVFNFDMTYSNRNGFKIAQESTPVTVGLISSDIFVNADGTVDKLILDNLGSTYRYANYDDWYAKEIKDYETDYDITEIPVEWTAG